MEKCGDAEKYDNIDTKNGGVQVVPLFARLTSVPICSSSN